jgi:ribonuclease Z
MRENGILMARLAFRILGAPGRDNALLVGIHTGQHIHRLLFDCGEDCVTSLSVAETQAIDHVLFSHLHMDHIAGFDSLFRRTFNRTTKPNLIWGPPATAEIIQHRLRGFMWNLVDQLDASWWVHDIWPDRVERVRYDARQAFAIAHPDAPQPRSGPLIAHAEYSVEAVTLQHGTPSLGYVVRAAPRRNIDTERMQLLGLTPGAWLQQVKHPQPGDAPYIIIAGQEWAVAALRAQLVVEQSGESLAYLTDFYLEQAAREQVLNVIRGCTILICESQYRSSDAELARRNFHMTSVMAARLAADAGVGRLVLFHLSERYTAGERLALREEARALFPQTELPPGWL